MTGNKRGLNKGLDALLVDTLGVSDVSQILNKDEAPSKKNVQASAGFVELKISQLKPGRFQPRKTINEDELTALSDSIRSKGILQPLVVRMLAKGGYEIIAGERRWRAAQKAGLKSVPVIIKEASDETALMIAMIENIQRENLNIVEEAVAFERMAKEFKLTHAEIAKHVGRSRTGITNTLRLLALRADVKKLLEEKKLEAGHGKVLLALQGAQQSTIAKIVVENKLSVRETEKLVTQALTKRKSLSEKLTAKQDPDVVRLQRKLSEKLGSPVKINHGEKGKGKIIIQYDSLDQLDGILSHIQ